MKIKQIDLDTKVCCTFVLSYESTKVLEYEARDTWDSRRGGRARDCYTRTRNTRKIPETKIISVPVARRGTSEACPPGPPYKSLFAGRASVDTPLCYRAS